MSGLYIHSIIDMITIRIQIKSHLQEYIAGKYGEYPNLYVRFPDQLDIYHTIFNLTEKRPAGCPVDTGNLEIVLPHPHGSKHPETYNYLSVESQKKIEQKLEVMFWSELREFIDYERHRRGTSYIESVYTFMRKYGIASISEDALIKNYYRWRKKVRNPEKRAYHAKKS